MASNGSKKQKTRIIKLNKRLKSVSADSLDGILFMRRWGLWLSTIGRVVTHSQDERVAAQMGRLCRANGLFGAAYASGQSPEAQAIIRAALREDTAEIDRFVERMTSLATTTARRRKASAG